MQGKSLAYIAVLVALVGILYIAFKPKPVDDNHPAPSSVTTAQSAAPAAAPAAAPEAAPAATPGATSSAPSPAATGTAPAAAAQTPSDASSPDAKANVFEIAVHGGKRTSGPAVIKVKKDDEVTLSITSDKADTVHLHGYDLHADLKPGQTATLRFKANLTGRFVYELHHEGTELGALEVFPR